MVRREIEIDEETDQILTGLAQQAGADRGAVVADLLRSYAGIEGLVSQWEEPQIESLERQRQRSEQDFRESNTVGWDEVKHHKPS